MINNYSMYRGIVKFDHLALVGQCCQFKKACHSETGSQTGRGNLRRTIQYRGSPHRCTHRFTMTLRLTVLPRRGRGSRPETAPCFDIMPSWRHDVMVSWRHNQWVPSFISSADDTIRCVQRAKGEERRAKSKGRRAKGKGQRAKGKEQRAKSKGQRAKSKEQRAKSKIKNRCLVS